MNLFPERVETYGKHKVTIKGPDPFQYMRITQLCMAIYKMEFLKPGTIGAYRA